MSICIQNDFFNNLNFATKWFVHAVATAQWCQQWNSCRNCNLGYVNECFQFLFGLKNAGFLFQCVLFLLLWVGFLITAMSTRLQSLNLTGAIILYERHSFHDIGMYASKFTTFIKKIVDLGFQDFLMASFSFYLLLIGFWVLFMYKISRNLKNPINPQ